MSSEIKVENLSDTAVRLNVVLEASPERIYRAWTTPSEVMQWFCPEPGTKCEVGEMDLRVGGRYRLTMTLPDVQHVTVGEYLALEPNRLIKFSWQGSCGTAEEGVSEVTVELEPTNGGTRLSLTHERLANVESRDRHAFGWTGCLNGLLRYAGTL